MLQLNCVSVLWKEATYKAKIVWLSKKRRALKEKNLQNYCNKLHGTSACENYNLLFNNNSKNWQNVLWNRLFLCHFRGIVFIANGKKGFFNHSVQIWLCDNRVPVYQKDFEIFHLISKSLTWCWNCTTTLLGNELQWWLISKKKSNRADEITFFSLFWPLLSFHIVLDNYTR